MPYPAETGSLSDQPVKLVVLIPYRLNDVLALLDFCVEQATIGIVGIVGSRTGEAVQDRGQSADTVIDIFDSYRCSVAGVAFPSPERGHSPLREVS